MSDSVFALIADLCCTHSVADRTRIGLLTKRRKQMGRPLRKDIFGTDVIGTPVSNSGITCEFYDGSTNQTDGVIIKQRGARSFVVCRVGDIGTTASYFVCKLVNTTPNLAGEMRIMGSPVSGTSGGESGGTSAGLVAIAKLTRRIAYGFPSVPVLNSASSLWNSEDSDTSTNHDQKRYTWYLENDSSADYIVLQETTTVM
jgi:hypothetical protein